MKKISQLFWKVKVRLKGNFIEKRLQLRCSPVNVVKFLRTVLFTEHVRLLLLYIYRNMTVMNTKANRKYFCGKKILITSKTYPCYKFVLKN